MAVKRVRTKQRNEEKKRPLFTFRPQVSTAWSISVTQLSTTPVQRNYLIY